MGPRHFRQRRRDQGVLDGVADVRIGKARGQALANGVAQTLPGQLVDPAAANHVRAGDDFHAAGGMFLEDSFPFQIGVGPRHDLRIRQQLLGQLAIVRQPRPCRQIARGHVRHDLDRDLIMNRRRGIVLDVEHNSMLTRPSRQFNH